MTTSTLSARGAAKYLGFTTSNPILDAIRSGELAAERGAAGRNGQPGNFRIQRTELDRYASARGLEPAGASANGQEHATAPKAEVSNVARLVAVPRAVDAPTDQLGYVTIPIEHYAQLIADRTELRLLREHPELLRSKATK